MFSYYKTVRNTLLLFSSITVSVYCAADVAVIVHPDNASAITTAEIKKIYLGKLKKFSDGSSVSPLERTEGSSIRVFFVENLVGKNESQMKSYWSRLIFSGKANPPKEVSSDSEVKSLVSKDVEAIGYIDASAVDSSVKVVTTF